MNEDFQQEQTSEWNYKWTNALDLGKVELFPVQFSNCERIEHNDAVYIFDEVGCGKTISSGLMVLHYLYNNPGKKVLVITANALVKSNTPRSPGQFLDDWFKKLPFSALGMCKSVEVINNHYVSIQRKAENRQEYGLIIVDEAHLFLNKETERYDALIGLKSEKIVFLTATPIKSEQKDLYTYVEIAKDVLSKPMDRSWVEKINTQGKAENEIICSIFDPRFPVTRYFKDTIMSINKKGYEKTKGKRLFPKLWKYTAQGDETEAKIKALRENIESILNKDGNSKFVVFTRLVKDEAYKIRDNLCENGFHHYEKQNSSRSVMVVTGENSSELEKFKGYSDLPTVLILTYQIAEQGVNLPGYNYVVNYHISAFPSSLEQRFGRIDRMGKNGSAFDEIHMSFLVSEYAWDTSTCNFYAAVSTYIRQMLSYLPSKNMILSEEILKQYKDKKDFLAGYLKELRAVGKDTNKMHLLYQYAVCLPQDKEKCANECDHMLREFVDEYRIADEIDKSSTEKEIIKKLREKIQSKTEELISDFNSVSDRQIEICQRLLKKESDKIFYVKRLVEQSDQADQIQIEMVDAAEKCGVQINELDEFKQYKSLFMNIIKLPLLVDSRCDMWSKQFEQFFMKNEMDKVFPPLGYAGILQEIAQKETDLEKAEKEADLEKKEKLEEEDIKQIAENADLIVTKLPFFKMCDKYRQLLEDECIVEDGRLRIKFDDNPFYNALRKLGQDIWCSIEQVGLSKDFINQNWRKKEEYSKESNWHFYDNKDYYRSMFSISKDEEGDLRASRWYGLTYQYLREEFAYVRYCEADRPEFVIDPESELLLNEKRVFGVAKLFEESNYNEETFDDKLAEMAISRDRIFSYGKDLKRHKSLFKHCLWGEYKERVFVEYLPLNKEECCNGKIRPGDIWTNGIVRSFYPGEAGVDKWSSLVRLPEYYKNLKI